MNQNIRDRLLENFPNFEMLDAKIASGYVVRSLLRPWSYTCRVARQIVPHLISSHLIQNSQFKKKVSLEEQKV